MKNIYKYRGLILLLAALLLILSTGTPSFDRSTTVSIVLIFIGIILRIFSRESIGNHTRDSIYKADQLITTGTYSLVRHPLYLSNFLIALGAIFLHLGFSVLTLPFILFILIFFHALSKSEDLYLKEKFNEQWIQWKKNTWAFIPKFNHYQPTPNRKTFFQAFLRDSTTWILLTLLFFIIILEKIIVYP